MHEQNRDRGDQRKRWLLPTACALVAAFGVQVGSGFAAERQRPATLANESCEIISVEPRARQRAAAPVRLPPVEPVLFSPIAVEELHRFEPAPAVELGLGLPIDARPSIGGWIGVGYSGHGLFQ